MIPDDKEEYQVHRRPEVALHALWLLRYYMQRRPGEKRWCLPYYAFTMARALLGLHAQADHWSVPDYMDERLRTFGLEPETFAVVDKRRWAIAWKILNRHWAKGAPWRLQRDLFQAEFDKAMRTANHVEEAAPVSYTLLRDKYRPRRDSWNVKRPNRKAPKQSFYRPQNIFSSRVSRYLSELEAED